MLILPSKPNLVTMAHALRPFSPGADLVELPAGGSITDMLTAVGWRSELAALTHVYIGDHLVERRYWSSVHPKAGVRVTVNVVPAKSGGGGKKNVLGTVLQIAVMAAAVAAGQYWAAAQVAAAGGAAASAGAIAGAYAGGAAITAGISIVGSLAISALVPPAAARLPATGGAAESPTLAIAGARNAAQLYGKIPRPLGRILSVPPLGAQTYTELVGDDQYLRMLVVWGYGPLLIEDIRIGENPLSAFDDIEIETRQGWPNDVPVTLVPGQVREEALAVDVTQEAGWQTRTTDPNIDEISIDIGFLRGLCVFDDAGSKTSRSVELRVQYRPVGAAAWTDRPAWITTAAQAAAVRRGERWQVARGQYDVRIQRVTADATSDRVLDLVTWTALRSIRNESPLAVSGLAVSALRIKATGQLSGVVDQLRATVTSICADWDSATASWVERPTANPASLYRLILTDRANAKRVSESRIQLADLEDWHEYCSDLGWTFGHIVDYRTSVRDALQLVASAGRASPTIRDMRHSVVIDRPQAIVMGMYTPRNSWGYEKRLNYLTPPHAWRVQFLNDQADYQRDERVVYVGGHTPETATEYETLELIGPTHPEQVYKQALYHDAAARLRRATHAWNADVEAMVHVRGDMVALAHDAVLVGLGSARIVAREPASADEPLTAMHVDAAWSIEPGQSYAVQMRNWRGEVVTAAVQNIVSLGDRTKVMFATPVPANRSIRAGDLVTFGEAGRVTVNVVIKSIEPGSGLSYRITAVDAAPEIFGVDSGVVPPYTASITLPTDLRPVTAPRSVTAQVSALLMPDGAAVPALAISWVGTGDNRVTGYAVAWRSEGETAWSSVVVPATERSHIAALTTTGPMTARVQALATVRASGWAYLAAPILVVGDTVAPGRPLAITVEGLAFGYRVVVAPAADADIATTELATAAAPGGPWQTVAVQGGDTFVVTGQPTGQTRYFRARHIDRSGNVGDWLVAGVATTVARPIQAEDLALTIIEQVERVPALALDIGRVGTQVDVASGLRGVVDNLAEAVLSLTYGQWVMDSTLRDAGIRVDPASGQVVITALERLTSTVSQQSTEVEARFDGVEGKIALTATRADLNELAVSLLAQTQPAAVWDFNGSAEGWTGEGATLTSDATTLLVAGTGDQPALVRTGLSINADDNTSVSIVVRRIAGTGWAGGLYWTVGGVERGPYLIAPRDLSDYAVLQLALDSVEGWAGTITGLRLVLGSGAGDTFEVDRITVGKNLLQELLLNEVLARVGSAELRLDAAESSITAKASALSVSDLTVRTSTAELEIDGLQAGLALKASAAALTAAESAITAAALEISALKQSIALQVTDYRTEVDQLAGLLLDDLLRADRIQTDVTTRLASARLELIARAEAGDGVLAAQILDLVAQVGGVGASVVVEQQARVFGDQANANQIASLSATVGQQGSDIVAANAAIAATNQAVATGDQANAAQIASLSATVGQQGSDIVAANAAIAATNQAVATGDQANAAQIASLSATVNQHGADIVAANAAIAATNQAVATGDQANAAQIASLSATVSQHGSDIVAANAAIAATNQAVATGDQANAAQIANLSATVGQQSATIQTVSQVAAAATDGVTRVSAYHGLVLDAGGNVAVVEALADGSGSGLNFAADQIRFRHPGATDLALTIQDGRVVIPAASVGTLTSDNIQVGTLDFDRLAAGSVAIVTDMISASAVSDTYLEFDDSDVALVTDHQWHDLIEVTGFPARAGVPVVVDFSGSTDHPPFVVDYPNGRALYVRVLVGSQPLEESNVGTFLLVSFQGSAAFGWGDINHRRAFVPTDTGSVTIKMQYKTNVAANFLYRQLTVQHLKR